MRPKVYNNQVTFRNKSDRRDSLIEFTKRFAAFINDHSKAIEKTMVEFVKREVDTVVVVFNGKKVRVNKNKCFAVVEHLSKGDSFNVRTSELV